jgi:DNA repair protein RadA/Sms
VALAVALASALRDKPIGAGTVLCGEIALTGELRPVNGLERRLREAQRIGYSRAIVPARTGRREGNVATEDGDLRAMGIEVVRAANVREALAAVIAPPRTGALVATGTPDIDDGSPDNLPVAIVPVGSSTT